MSAKATTKKISRRTASGDDKRGNSRDRRARKLWMLGHFGDGTTCACAHCGEQLEYAELEADRITPGGSYRRDNIQPSCGKCNKARSNNTAWISPLMATLAKAANTAAAECAA